MNDIARRLVLEPVFVSTQWEVLREMQAHRYDCVVGGINEWGVQ